MPLKLNFRMRTLLLLVTVASVVVFMGMHFNRWQRLHKSAQEWVQPLYRQTASTQRRSSPSPTTMEEKDQLKVIEYAILRLSDRRKRVAGLKLLLEIYPEHAVDVLRKTISRQRDPAVLASMLRVLSLRRDRQDLTLLKDRLNHRDDRVRRAAMTGIGVIHQPQFQLAGAFFSLSQAPWIGTHELNTIPPIFLDDFLNQTSWYSTEVALERIDFSSSVRDHIEQQMVESQSRPEREAAARVLVGWPPGDYKLRLAEWGVWLSDNGRMDLIEEIVDEIPPFVHRTGDKIKELQARVIQPITIVTKPIVHLTADRPLAVNLRVRLARGRPWFAYPLPDDFALATAFWTTQLDKKRKPLPTPGKLLEKLARADHGKLLRPGEGYPWLVRRRRWYGALSAEVGGFRGTLGQRANSYDIVDVGLRWQSLIVAPDRREWMQMPELSKLATNPRYRWWKQLRDVPSSWLTSRGETERFLYYDGPTLARAPVQVTVKESGLEFVHRQMFTIEVSRHDTWDSVAQTGPDVARRAIYLDVDGTGSATGRPLVVRPNSTRIELKTLPLLEGDKVTVELMSMFTEFGLTKDESQGLIDAWRRGFLEKPGRRLLMLLTPDEYDALCPLEITPQPTEVVRMGIILTEL